MASVAIPVTRFGPGAPVNTQGVITLQTSQRVSALQSALGSRTGIRPSQQLLVDKATMKRLDPNEFLSRYTQGGTFEVYLRTYSVIDYLQF